MSGLGTHNEYLVSDALLRASEIRGTPGHDAVADKPMDGVYLLQLAAADAAYAHAADAAPDPKRAMRDSLLAAIYEGIALT